MTENDLKCPESADRLTQSGLSADTTPADWCYFPHHPLCHPSQRVRPRSLPHRVIRPLARPKYRYNSTGLLNQTKVFLQIIQQKLLIKDTFCIILIESSKDLEKSWNCPRLKITDVQMRRVPLYLKNLTIYFLEAMSMVDTIYQDYQIRNIIQDKR